jgi:hypothetical protein
VDILGNAQMAGTGFELVVVFRGKSYILGAVQYMSDSVDMIIFSALGTKNGNETVDEL